MQGEKERKERQTPQSEGQTRRNFLKVAFATTVAGMTIPFAHAQGRERIRVGVIGCGGRGTGAALDAATADPSVEIYALGDLFRDRLEGCLRQLKERLGDRCNVPPDRCFTGFQNFKGVISTEVDIVILAEPPAFRPAHFRAAIEAGKHVFMEKPVAVCPTGARIMLEYSRLAEKRAWQWWRERSDATSSVTARPSNGFMMGQSGKLSPLLLLEPRGLVGRPTAP